MATSVAPKGGEAMPAVAGAADAENCASMSEYDALRNRMRARSLSTRMRVATLCTRPADSRGRILRHRTGETS